MADIKSNNATIKQALLLYQQHLLFQNNIQETYMPKNGKLNATPQDLAREEAYRKEMQNVTALLSSDQIIPEKTGNHETLPGLYKSPEPDTKPYINPLSGLWVFPETPYSPGPSGSTSISDGWGLVDRTKSVTSLGPASPAKDHRSESLDSVGGIGSAPDGFGTTRHQLKSSTSSVKRKPLQISSPPPSTLNKKGDTVSPPTRPPPLPPAPPLIANTVPVPHNVSDVGLPRAIGTWSPNLQHFDRSMAPRVDSIEPYHNPITMPPPQPTIPMLPAGRPNETHAKHSHLSPSTVNGQFRHDTALSSALQDDQTTRDASFQSATWTHVMSGSQGVSPPVPYSSIENGSIYNNNNLGGGHREPPCHGMETPSHNDQQQPTFDSTSAHPVPQYREQVVFSTARLGAFGQPTEPTPSPILQQSFAMKNAGLSAAHSANASVSSFHLDNRHQPVKPLDCRMPEPSTIQTNHNGDLSGVRHHSWTSSDLTQGGGNHSQTPQTNFPPSYETVLHEMQMSPELPSQHRPQPTGPTLRPFGATTMNLGVDSPSVEPIRGSVDYTRLPNWPNSPLIASVGATNPTKGLAQTKAPISSFVSQNGPTANSLRPSGFAPLPTVATARALQNPLSAIPAAPIPPEGGLTPNTLKAFASIPKDTSQIPSFAPADIDDDWHWSNQLQDQGQGNFRPPSISLPVHGQQDTGVSHQPTIPKPSTFSKPVAESNSLNHNRSPHAGMQSASYLTHDEMANLQRLQDEFNQQDDLALAKQEAFARQIQTELDAAFDSDETDYHTSEYQHGGSRALPGSWQHHAPAGLLSHSGESSQWQSLGSESDDDDVPITSAMGVNSSPQGNLIIKPPTVARAPFVTAPKPQNPISPKGAGRTKNEAELGQSAADEIEKYEAAQRAQENAAAQAARASLIASQAASRVSSTSKKVECTSCSDKDSASAMATLPCQHAYCGMCIADAFKHAFSAGKVFICCNKTPCPVELASRFLPAEFVTLYKSKLEERMATNLVYCAKPGCAAFIPESNLKGPLATCGKCGFISCSLCKNPEHKGICPPDSMGLKLMDLAGNKNWVQCSRCKAVVERDDGCLHMTCTCGYEFCYSCGGKWDQCGSSCPRKA